MDVLKRGWFSEVNALWPGQSFSLEYETVLERIKSPFQEIVVVQSKSYGRVLVLDGVIQCTERDEFSYQEMITFLPLNSHPNPKDVLVIGGGDGGVVREAVKHPMVETITLCEIDQAVVDVSKKYLPTISSAFDNPKLNLHIGDGLEFIKNNDKRYDVIITDSSDPIGPAETLFQAEYYSLLRDALNPGGIICCQGESMWFNLELIRRSYSSCNQLYAVVSYAFTTIPSYPGGSIGFLLAALNPETDFREPITKWDTSDAAELGLRYYNADVHKAAFILPQFVTQALNEETGKVAKRQTNQTA